MKTFFLFFFDVFNIHYHFGKIIVMDSNFIFVTNELSLNYPLSQHLLTYLPVTLKKRSEERRVGKEC